MSDQPKPTGDDSMSGDVQRLSASSGSEAVSPSHPPKPIGEQDFVDCSESAKFIVNEMFEYGWLKAVSRDQATEWLRDWLSHAKHPTQPTGEWTEGMVFAYWESEDWQGLADAHKAQIAAAYQKGYEDGRTDKNTIE